MKLWVMVLSLVYVVLLSLTGWWICLPEGCAQGKLMKCPKSIEVISKPLWMHTQIFTATLVIVSSSIQVKICDVLTHRPKWDLYSHTNSTAKNITFFWLLSYFSIWTDRIFFSPQFCILVCVNNLFVFKVFVKIKKETHTHHSCTQTHLHKNNWPTAARLSLPFFDCLHIVELGWGEQSGAVLKGVGNVSR